MKILESYTNISYEHAIISLEDSDVKEFLKWLGDFVVENSFKITVEIKTAKGTQIIVINDSYDYGMFVDGFNLRSKLSII